MRECGWRRRGAALCRPAEGSGLDQLLNCDIVGEQFGGQLNVISQTDAFFTEFLIPLSQEMEASYGGQQ